MDYKVLKALEANQGREMALATIVRVRGSAPRHEGTQMLVFEDGSFVGTVGGGCGEDRIRAGAQMIIEQQQSQFMQILLNDDIAMEEGMICGGNLETFVEYIDDPGPYLRAVRLVDANETGLMIYSMDDPGEKTLYAGDGRILLGPDRGLSADQVDARIRKSRLVLEDRVVLAPVLPTEKLLILGGGHVALPVARIGKMLDFEVTVADDRKEFANADRFPDADRVLCAPFDELLEGYPLDGNTFVVLVTRGHTYDGVCLQHILPGDWRYIGMIGSRKRVRMLKEALVEKGFDRDLLDRIHSPVGLKIGAETPEEIAISILGEIIAVRRGKDSKPGSVS